LADASQIDATDVADEMRAQGFRDTWEAREPQAVAAFFHDLEQTLGYLTVHFPRVYVSLIYTINVLERFHKEIRRQQRDLGMLQSPAGGDVRR
jgi:transposase-like protein